jgi:hypothetical protein
VFDTIAAAAGVLLYAGLTREVLPASIAKEVSQLSDLCVRLSPVLIMQVLVLLLLCCCVQA